MSDEEDSFQDPGDFPPSTHELEEMVVHDQELVFGVIYDPHFSDTPPSSRKDDYVTACFDKTQWVANDVRSEGGSFLLMTGDIFHKKIMSTKFMSRFCKFFAGLPIPVFGIQGNHDVYAGNSDFINRTSLGVVFASGVIKKLDHLLVDVSQAGFGVHLRGFDFRPAFHVQEHANDDLSRGLTLAGKSLGREDWVRWHLAMAHGFTHMTHAQFTTKDYVNVPSFTKAGYNALFLGHDHVPYEPEDMGGILVCRGGSMTRGTKHKYQRVRDVQYHLVTVTREGISVEARKIPCAPPEEVYSGAQIEREDLNLKLQHFIKKLKENKQKAANTDDVFSILERLPVREETKKLCVRYLNEAGIVREGGAG